MRIGFHHYYRQALILLTILILGSCNRRSEDIPIIPPENPPLSRQLIGYGVINVSYTHVVGTPEPAASSLGYLRRGSVVKVLERQSVINRTAANAENAESWVLVEGNFRGWLSESVVDIYDNESQARTAAESMTQ
jgi:hypothetical protein